jgi:carotenoid cleavage dioxygenase-like enzyme
VGTPTKPFPDRPLLRRHWKPWPIEGTLRDAVVIQGEVPADLTGTLFRIGPNPRYAPLGTMYNAWMGDGMMHAISISEGKVQYRNRWVRTPKFQAEDAAGSAVFDYVLPERFPILATGLEITRDNPASRGFAQGSCNTSLSLHDGYLLAWGEGQSTPTKIDPTNLDTIGFPDWTTALGDSLTPKVTEHGFGGGHPRVCPLTGEVLFYTIAVTEPFLTIHIFDPTLETLRSVAINSPYPSYIHDFMITDNHAVAVVSPITMSQDRVLAGEGLFGWEPELGTHVAVVPRAPGGAVQWFSCDENAYSLHPQNAYERDGQIIFDTPEFPIAPVPMAGLKPHTQFKGLESHLKRWRLDLATGTMRSDQLDDRHVELPRIDERFQGLDYRYGFNAYKRGDLDDFLFNSVIRYDMSDDSVAIHDFAEETSVCEPIFVPLSADAPEGVGYLMTLVYRPDEDRSVFVILDAQNLAAEPLATVAFPHRVPFSAHGCWAPDILTTAPSRTDG